MNSPVSSTHLSFISIPIRRRDRPFSRLSVRVQSPENSSPRRHSTPPQTFTPKPLPREIALPGYCPNCSIPLAPSPNPEMSPSRRALTPTISPIVKPGQLAHPLPPTEGSSTESTCCIPSQVVTAALLSNPISGAAFVIFRRKTRLSSMVLPKPSSSGGRSPIASEVTAAVRSDASSATVLAPRISGPLNLLNPAVQQQVWDVVSGHIFGITQHGSVLYRGRERTLESTFVSNWMVDKGSLQRLEPLGDSGKEYRFALYGPGNHTSSFKTFSQCNGKGTWRRLLGEADDVGREGKATHIVFMQLPEVLAQMVALGVSANGLIACLKQGEYGTLRLEFEPGEWTSPEEREGERAGVPQDKAKEWKKGWWFTERQGMGVWIS